MPLLSFFRHHGSHSSCCAPGGALSRGKRPGRRQPAGGRLPEPAGALLVACGWLQPTNPRASELSSAWVGGRRLAPPLPRPHTASLLRPDSSSPACPLILLPCRSCARRPRMAAAPGRAAAAGATQILL